MAKKHSEEYQIHLFVPDLHSFTTPINHDELQERIRNNVRLFVASGLPLDNPDIHIYRQSYIPAHSELAWILNCFTGFGEMERMTQFKDKAQKTTADRINLGLFNYPVLMAADILLYGATYVPVGDDQTQHLEFTRNIAQRMNAKFGEVFVLPKPVQEQHVFFGNDQGLRIKDLQNPTIKMSKSDDTGKGVIFLNDSPEVAVAKIMSATTDSIGSIDLNWEVQPGISNLLQILSLLKGVSLEDVVVEWKGRSHYGELKSKVADEIGIFLTSLQQNMQHINDDVVLQKLNQSEVIMNDYANNTLRKVQQAVGLRNA
jgi:tryptophanyl-tRNA synthetase